MRTAEKRWMGASDEDDGELEDVSLDGMGREASVTDRIDRMRSGDESRNRFQ
jgi:hypothetical protein